jgi:hypothetical protein
MYMVLRLYQLANIITEDGYPFTYREYAEKVGISKRHAKRIIDEAVKLDLVAHHDFDETLNVKWFKSTFKAVMWAREYPMDVGSRIKDFPF